MKEAVLLTGTSGYVGSCIAAALSAEGVDVVTAGRRPQDMINLDLESPAKIRLPSLPVGLTTCVHAAAWNEVRCAADPVASYITNVAATRALLAEALAAGIRHFVYISTFHVFGKLEGDLNEDSVVTPTNDYGLTHRLAEEVFLMAARGNGCSIHVLRPANLFGLPKDWGSFARWSLAPFDFIKQGAQDGTIVLRTDGSAIRNYISIDYLCAAVTAVLRDELPQGIAHVVGRAWSMANLAQAAAGVVGRETGASVPVTLGNRHLSEEPYRFGSRLWPAESDDDGLRMEKFMLELFNHIRGTGVARNE
jgi:UDP-glucose 4-epimerase